MDDREHERMVCRFAAQKLADRRMGGEFDVDRYPDEEEHVEEAVDVIGHDELGAVAIEHTVIEAYDSQIHDNKRFEQLFDGFAQRFGQSLPMPGYYALCIDLGAGAAARGKLTDLPGIIEQWVRMEAEKLPEPKLPPDPPNHIRAQLPGPIPVTIFRLGDGPGEEGSLTVGLLSSGGIEGERTARIGIALDKKIRKLEKARPPGGRTLLVLENWDFMLSNPVVIAQAVHSAAQRLAPLPDEIVCVDTSAGVGAWREYPIKIDYLWSDAALDLPSAPS